MEAQTLHITDSTGKLTEAIIEITRQKATRIEQMRQEVLREMKRC